MSIIIHVRLIRALRKPKKGEKVLEKDRKKEPRQGTKKRNDKVLYQRWNIYLSNH